MPNNIMSQEEAQNLFNYNPEGYLTWKNKPSGKSSVIIGGKVGSPHSGSNFFRVTINKKIFYVHYLIWAYHGGDPNVKYLIHIDGDKSNNKIENIRESTLGEHRTKTGKAMKNSKTGIRGVYPHKNKFLVRIRHNKEYIHVGYFSTIEEAEAAYHNAINNLSPTETK